MTGKRIFAAFLFVGILVLVSLPSSSRDRLRLAIRRNLAPIQNLLAGDQGVAKIASTLVRPGALLEKNRLLEEQVGNLRFEMSQTEVVRAENEDLRRALGMKARVKGRLLLCNVTTRGDSSGWWQTLNIDRGSAQGVRAGMPVLTPDGVVGRTQYVTAYNAEVLLLTDPTFKISCRSSQSGILGIVQGQGNGIGGDESLDASFSLLPCRLDLASRAALLQEGERVLTSGLGGIFPADLTVGFLTAPALDESKLFQTALVNPAVPMDRLDRVFVMLNGRNETNTPSLQVEASP